MMNSRICEMLDIEFPLVAFTHCRDVVVAVSKAGGCGVLGAVGMSPEQLEKELKWIDEHIDGKPYGVDVLIPNKMVGKDEKFDADKLAKMIPQEYADFRTDVLANHGIDAPELRKIDTAGSSFAANTQSDGAKALLDVAFKHPIKIIKRMRKILLNLIKAIRNKAYKIKKTKKLQLKLNHKKA